MTSQKVVFQIDLDALISLRTMRRWTKKETAKRSGLSEAHYGRIENGDYAEKGCTANVLGGLANAFGINPSELVIKNDGDAATRRSRRGRRSGVSTADYKQKINELINKLAELQTAQKEGMGDSPFLHKIQQEALIDELVELRIATREPDEYEQGGELNFQQVSSHTRGRRRPPSLVDVTDDCELPTEPTKPDRFIITPRSRRGRRK